VRRFSGLPPKLVTRSLLGQPLQVVEGSVRNHSDYDDAWFLASAMHSEVIFDVGANQGHMAVLALLCPSVRQIVLFEPNPQALLIAAENLIRNQLSAKARFVCAFVSDRSGGVARLWTVGTGAAGSMWAGHAETASRAGRSIEVSTVTVDDVMAAHDLVPDLVKVDVEGAEGFVLEGARRCAMKRKARFLVEMHSNPELPMLENAAQALEWCGQVGYAAWYLAAGAPLRSAEDVSRRGRCHLLLQPSDWPYPAWLVGIPQSADLSAVAGTPVPIR
jgi:FkbM family methyltransferase